MKFKNLKAGISLILLIGLSFNFGRLFEIFAWNTNVIRIENISHFSQSDESSSYNYIQLNDQYWKEKAAEDSKIRINFSDQYKYLNEIFGNRISYQQVLFRNHKLELMRRFVLGYSQQLLEAHHWVPGQARDDR